MKPIIYKPGERRIKPFYCENCGLDYEREGIYYPGYKGCDKWESRCPKCEKVCIRYGQNTALDPYFKKSKNVARQRRELAWEDEKYKNKL